MQKNKDVVKEREVISGWLRNGQPGGVAGLAKEMAVDEAHARRRADGYATTNRFHVYHDSNRPKGGVGVDFDGGGGGDGKKGGAGSGGGGGGSGGAGKGLGSTVASKLTASTRPPSNQSIAAAAGKGAVAGGPAGGPPKQSNRLSNLM